MAAYFGPTKEDIEVTRGDSPVIPVKVTDATTKLPVDVTGGTFVLTVDPSEEPADAAGNLFALTGTVVNGPGGLANFQPTTSQLDVAPGEYYYDVQMTLAGSKRTILKGKFTVQQDIGKS